MAKQHASTEPVSSSDNRYLYQKIAEDLRSAIQAGKLTPGDRLPSLDNLAETYSVNRITVRRALTELRDDGLIYAVPAEGTYVAEPLSRRPTRDLLSIGLVSHVLQPAAFGPYHTEIIAGIQEPLGRANAHLVLMPEAHIRQQSRIFELISKLGLDGILYLGAFETATLRRMVEKGPPCVLVDCTLRGGTADAVQTDNEGGAYEAIEHLLGLGHRKLACILGPHGDPVTRQRILGVQAALADAGIPEKEVRMVTPAFEQQEHLPAMTRQAGKQAMQELLEGKRRPTAVFCFNDEMATGALQAVLERGDLRVPRDISIIGFDDIPWATAVHPHLTTIRVEKRLMGQLGARQLIKRLQAPDPDQPRTATVTPTRLIVRESTGPAPKP